MKPVNKFKTLFYTGLFIVLAPIAITIAMFIFSGSSIETESKKEVTVINVAAPVLPKPEAKPIIDTARPIIAKPKKKKIETVDTVKIIKPDTTILKTDTL